MIIMITLVGLSSNKVRSWQRQNILASLATIFCVLTTLSGGSQIIATNHVDAPGSTQDLTSLNVDQKLMAVERHKDDETGIEYEELAFRAPTKGIPKHVIDMYCANIKLRLYWGQYRDQTMDTHRKGTFLRRMARFARHLYEDIRDVDKPFEGPLLSIIDEYFPAKEPGPDDKIASRPQSCDDKLQSKKSVIGALRKIGVLKSCVAAITEARVKKSLETKTAVNEGSTHNNDMEAVQDVVEASDAYNEIVNCGENDKLMKVKGFLRQWSKKVGIGIYTRVRTMWWLMMACLFAKYYLWDPALDEYVQLQRTLVMFPEIQLLKLQDLDCKPTMFFRRLLDVCKIMNPLMNIHFGQLSLDKTLRSGDKY